MEHMPRLSVTIAASGCISRGLLYVQSGLFRAFPAKTQLSIWSLALNQHRGHPCRVGAGPTKRPQHMGYHGWSPWHYWFQKTNQFVMWHLGSSGMGADKPSNLKKRKLLQIRRCLDHRPVNSLIDQELGFCDNFTMSKLYHTLILYDIRCIPRSLETWLASWSG